jgi:hypothetical protein
MDHRTAQRGAVLHDGWRAVRRRIQATGPFAGLLPAALLGGVGTLLLATNKGSTVRGLGGFVLCVLGAPGLIVAGVPLRAGSTATLAGVVGSIVLWFVIGTIAATRAARRPVCGWRDYWREFLWIAAGVWVGVAGAGLAANLVTGRALF